MNIVGRKEVCNFIYHIFQEGKYFVVSGTIDDFGCMCTHTRNDADKIFNYGTCQFRIGSQ